MKSGILFAAAILAATSTVAQPPQKIYRCGADGRELSQVPCRSGSSEAVVIKAGPSEADRAEAADVHARASEAAERLQREREKREAREARNAASAVGVGPSAQDREHEAAKTSATRISGKSRSKKSSNQGDEFAAIIPGSSKK